jgi:hypothetical protein
VLLLSLTGVGVVVVVCIDDVVLVLKFDGIGVLVDETIEDAVSLVLVVDVFLLASVVFVSAVGSPTIIVMNSIEKFK